MAENRVPTNIERLSDLIDLEVEDGTEVEIEEPLSPDGMNDIAVELSDAGGAEINSSANNGSAVVGSEPGAQCHAAGSVGEHPVCRNRQTEYRCAEQQV